MFRLHNTFLRIAIFGLSLSLFVFGAVLSVSAQEEGLTFEQAQMRTAHARRQMEEKRQALAEAEKREKAALQRLDDLKKQYEEAQKESEAATKAREMADTEYSQAKDRWSAESQQLKRIHRGR